MRYIALTGSSGFVGTNFIDYVRNDARIGIVKLSRNEQSGYVDSISDSINKYAFNAIVHLAGKAHDLKKVSDDLSYFKANTDITIELYNKFLNSSIPVFIYFSSVKAVADSVDGVLDELNEPNPKTVYGISKLKAEQYIFSNLPSDGKRVFILRPCMIHGPGNKGNLNLLYKMVSKGIPWPLGAYDNKRSLCSIENVCFIIKELIEREDIPQGVYNIADNETLSINELITLIAKTQNKSPKIFKVPKGLIKILAKIGDKLGLPLNSERLQKLTESYEVQNTKIINVLGKTLPVTNKIGLIKTFKSFD
jgi:nucleoside-diphosphate-sugar epimerase